MFFIVSKLLGYLLSPVLWIIALLIVGLITRNPRRKKRVVLAAVILFLFFTNSFIIGGLTRIWSAEGKRYEEIKPVYDVGIVLGGSTISFEESINRKIYNGNIDRIIQAVELYKQGRIKKIMITGASGNLVYADLSESQLLKEFLEMIEIPDSVILVEPEARNTYENALFCKRILEREGSTQSVLLITSSLHMRRSMACFRKQGLNVLINESFRTNLGLAF